MIKTPFDRKDFNITSRKRLFDSFLKVDQVIFDHLRFDGKIQTNVCREVLIRNDAVCVLPYDPLKNQIILIEQIRIGTTEKLDVPWMLETVAGLIDHDNESKNEVALREAQEEADITIKELIPICEYFSSSGMTSEKTYLYVGLCDIDYIEKYCGLYDEQEDIRAFSISLNEAMDLFNQGKIQNSSLIIALLWLNTNKQQFC